MTTPLRERRWSRRHRYDIVVAAASYGGIRALRRILSFLPPQFPVPIVAVLHRGLALPNYQAAVIGRGAPLHVKLASPSEELRPHTMFLARPHMHLVVGADHRLGFVDGRKIQHLRSSANPLFDSAAHIFGSRALAVVLTGGGRDASNGVQAVKQHGGSVIAQDEATSEDYSMPRSAIATGAVDQVLPLDEIGPAMVRLVSTRPV